MRIAIIVLNWQNAPMTIKCLESISKLSYKDFMVYVIDNGSQDDSLNIIKEKYPNYYYIKNEKNLGFAKGNNVGIKKALEDGADFIWLLNNDTKIIHTNTIEKIIASFKKDVGIVEPTLVLPNGENDIIWGMYPVGRLFSKILYGIPYKLFDFYYKYINKGILSYGYLSGASMIIKKDVFNKIGLLPEKYFFYGEDKEFCYKAKKNGYKLFIIKDVLIEHARGNSSSKKHKEKFYKQFLESEKLFVERNFSTLYKRIYRLLLNKIEKGRDYNSA